jgi:hypothetical protein
VSQPGSGQRPTPGTLGYDRALEWREPPSADEQALCGWSVVRAAGQPADAWRPLARIGGVHLYLAPPDTDGDAEPVFSEPLIAAKRGSPAHGGYVGIDGAVRRDVAYGDGAVRRDAVGAAAAPTLAIAAGPRPGPADSDAVRVAILDVSFDGLPLLRRFGHRHVDGPYTVGLPAPVPAPPVTAAAGHGTAMAGIVLHEAPGACVGLFRVPSVAGAVRAYAAATDLAIAIATAVEDWRADLVLVAMSEGAWGTPRHLREVLREAARAGRGGRGTAIVCSVGDPAKNHSHADDSAALGADDLASQPWVLAVAACDARGRWQRAEFEYRRAGAPGATYNRFGPGVALTAAGEGRLYSDGIAGDDSSQAAALAAAAAARALAAAPALGADELRAILAITADVPAVIDDGAGLAAGIFDGRDRLGHSPKVGYGRVNGDAAALAAADPIALALLSTRPCPDPARAGASLGHRLARAWNDVVLEGAARADGRAGDLARGYARVRGALARRLLHSLAANEAAAWLARHLRAIAETDDSSWLSATQDHGALVERIRHAAEVLAPAPILAAGAPERDDEASAWLRQLDAFLQSIEPLGGGPVAALGAAVLRRAADAAG